MKLVRLSVVISLLAASQASTAATKFVSDEFEIMLRTGQSTQHEIRRQIKSGTPLVVLKESDGYTKVRMPNGVEGWVLSRYLMNQPSGRDRLATLEKRHEKLKTKFDLAVAEEKAAMGQEINRLQEIAKRPLELQRENDQLNAQLVQEKDRYERLAAETEVLKSPLKDRKWFVSGALVVIGSMIFGIILTRIPWQRKKKWNQL
jgi:SH3 domain protein